MIVTASLIPRYCPKCEKNIYRWTDKPNWNTCDCGTQLQNVEIFRKTDGDKQEFFCQELGLLGEQQKQYKLEHPEAEFNSTGALKIKNTRHLEKVLASKGMVNLMDSPQYRDKVNHQMEQVRDEKH